MALAALVLIVLVLAGRSIDPELLGGAVADAQPPAAVSASLDAVSEPQAPDSDAEGSDPAVATTDPLEPEAESASEAADATPPPDAPAEVETPEPPPSSSPPAQVATARLSAPPPPSKVPTTNLEIIYQNRLKEAYLTVWVDGRRELSAKLEAKGLFKRKREHSWQIPVPVGRRSIEVHVSGVSKELEASRKVWHEFSVRDPQRLVVALPQGSDRLNLEWQAR